MFRGEFQHSMDSKSRTTLPMQFREKLGDSCVMTRGLEGCIFVFSKEAFDVYEEKMRALSIMNKTARKVDRIFIGSARDVDFGLNGRAVIPKHLLEHAGIDKEVVSVGMSSRIELWAKERWDEYCVRELTIDDDMAKQMEEMGF